MENVKVKGEKKRRKKRGRGKLMRPVPSTCRAVLDGGGGDGHSGPGTASIQFCTVRSGVFIKVHDFVFPTVDRIRSNGGEKSGERIRLAVGVCTRWSCYRRGLKPSIYSFYTVLAELTRLFRRWGHFEMEKRVFLSPKRMAHDYECRARAGTRRRRTD